MKTGTVVLGICSFAEGERDVAERCARYLKDKGRRNVRCAFYRGTPDAYSVMRDMFLNDGVDTFCILPLCIAEGDLTVWRMPRALTLPDNSGSWTRIGDDDIATRFSTALGFEYGIAEGILSRLDGPVEGRGVLLVSYGSKLSQSEKTAAAYASYLEDNGWTVGYGFTRFGRTAKEVAQSLVDNGCEKVDVIPLMISVGGRSFKEAVSEIKTLDCEFDIHEPVSELDAFYEILNGKVPEGW